MRRGELYRVRRPSGDPKKARVFVIISREALIRSRFSMLVCAPESKVTDLVGSLSTHRVSELRRALRFALDL